MHARTEIAAKTAESKREDAVFKAKRTDCSQSANSSVDHILHLQRTIGNQAVQKLFKSGVIQAKLRIGQPNDIYEQEADRVAEQVVRMPEPRLQRQAEEKEEEDLIQTKSLAEQITPLVQRQAETESRGLALELKEDLIKIKVPPKFYGLFTIGYTAKITLSGMAIYGEPSTGITVPPTQSKAGFEQKVAEVYGTDIKLIGTVDPGKESKIGVAIGSQLIEVEFSAQADLITPFQLAIEKTIPVTGQRIGDWTFSGNMNLRFEIDMSPSPTLIARAMRSLLSKAGQRVLRPLVAGGHGIYVRGAGWISSVTPLGAAVTVGSALAIGATIILLGLAMPAAAARQGKIQGLGFTFAHGYADMLAELTRPESEKIEWSESALGSLVKIDWKKEFKEQVDAYLDNPDPLALQLIYQTGAAAILQEVDKCVTKFGKDEWLRLARDHRQTYGKSKSRRYAAYRRTLYQQLSKGEMTGIPLTL